MLETKDLILDKGKLSDWKDMYENVWSRPESARYMFWNLTVSEEDAKTRMERTIAYQKSRDSWTVYEKKSGRAIGFAGVASSEPGVAEERGICLGPDYFRLGYGEQILKLLIDYAVRQYGAQRFRCFARETNAASRGLIEKLGFRLIRKDTEEDSRDGGPCVLTVYEKELDS